MKYLSYLSLALAAILTPLTSQAEKSQQARGTVDIFNWMPKASADPSNRIFGHPDAQKSKKFQKQAASTTREAEIKLSRLPAADDTGMLDAPDGNTWYYTVVYDKEYVQHEYYTETKIYGYNVTVYNEELKKLGSFEDTITLEPNETAVVRVEVGPQVTKKFFNVDDKYEVMMSLSINTTEYVNNYRTLVYQLDNNKALLTVPGIYVSAINTSTDAWSERFWITFATDEETTTPVVGTAVNSADYVFTTYKYAGYSGLGDPVLVNRVPLLCAPGEDAITFLATKKDGKPYFALNYLKYCWYLEPFNWEVEDPTPDNELIVDIYTASDSYSSTVEKYSTTRFPLNATIDDRYFLMTGTFSYNNDLAIGQYGDEPGLIITKATWTNAADEYVYDYDVYQAAPKGEDAEGKHLFNIGKQTSGGYFMADVPDADPQVMFIDTDLEEPEFSFVSLLTGEVQHTLPYRVADGYYLTAETERVPAPGGYLYVASQTRGTEDDEGNVYQNIVYVTPDGALDHIDSLNLGKDVDYAQVYTGYDGFDPFIFNLDDYREYMVLIKRRHSGGGNHEELAVVSANPNVKEPLLLLGPDEEMGALSGITFSNLGTDNAALIVIYVKGDSYTTVSHKLPFSFFEGEGTVDNPYIITTAGGLDHLRNYPDAHFVVANDIDAAGYTISPSNYTFTGSLDGRGHIISNLRLNGRALIPNITRATVGEIDPTVCAVRNINFVNPVFEATVDGQGLLCASLGGGIVENVHVYGGRMSSNKDDMGGLVGTASLWSSIEGCSVDADITAPNGSVGGIALRTRTSSTINACAFKGTINGATELGGIVGSADNVADRITNCHVNADITGDNTIGGVVGSSSRALVANCYVEGSLTAKAAPRWGGGVKTGGVIGSLDPWYPSESEQEQPSEPVVKGNIVALKSITRPAPEEGKYEGQNDTMHRIIGASQINATPYEEGYDNETQTPIYGDLQPAEKALAANYASSELACGSERVAPEATSTEGESIDTASLTHAWLQGIGFSFGAEAASPWNSDSITPQLWYEGGLLYFNPSTAEVNEGRRCKLTLNLAGETITDEMLDSFSLIITDSAVVDNEEPTLENDALTITFKGLKEGETLVVAELDGKKAEATIRVTPLTGVNVVTAEKSSPISYSGTTVSAQDCQIDVYTVGGTRVAGGHDCVSIANLDGGIYIVTATDTNGNRSSLKVRR